MAPESEAAPSYNYSCVANRVVVTGIVAINIIIYITLLQTHKTSFAPILC